jgi:hypothetical protein
MGARRDALAAALKIRLSPLLSRPDLDALERGLDLMDGLCGPRPSPDPEERPLYGPAELRDLTQLLPELTKLASSRNPLHIHHLREWRAERRAHSEMAIRLRVALACGYLPVDPTPGYPGAAWDIRDLQVLEPVMASLPPQFKRLGSTRTLRVLPLAPELTELQEVKEEWRRSSDRDKPGLAGRLARAKGALRVRLETEPLPAGVPGEAARCLHVPGELLSLCRLRGLRGCLALGLLYALAEEQYLQDERERVLFDQKLERVLKRERMADESARAYALAVTAFAMSPDLLEERWPRTHAHMLDRFDTSLAAFDGGALLRPAVEALLALR